MTGPDRESGPFAGGKEVHHDEDRPIVRTVPYMSTRTLGLMPSGPSDELKVAATDRPSHQDGGEQDDEEGPVQGHGCLSSSASRSSSCALATSMAFLMTSLLYCGPSTMSMVLLAHLDSSTIRLP